MRLSWRGIAVLVAAVGVVISMFGLTASAHSDPPCWGASFGDDIPGTICLPHDDPEEPLPVVVMAHGYSGDRVGFSTMARWLARNGYGVVSFDVRGHGTNNQPFVGDIRDDLIAVLDDVVEMADFDPSRIALVGHSMGAGLVVDHASYDERIKATVAQAGGWDTNGPIRPRNVLFLVPSSSDEGHREGRETAARIAGHAVEEDTTDGDIAAGTAVRVSTVKTAVAQIITSPGAGERTIEWLDSTLGVQRSGDPDVGADRRAFLLLFAPCILVLLVGVGAGVGRLAPAHDEVPATRWGGGLALLFLALLVPWPLTGFVTPTAFLSVDVADGLVSVYALTGAALVAAAAYLRRSPEVAVAKYLPVASEPFERIDRRTWAAAGVGALAFYLLLQPIGPFLHELVPTPKRLVLSLAIAAGVLVLMLPLEALLRRGSPRQAAVSSGLGRVLIIVMLQIGATIGVAPGFLLLAMPIVAAMFLLLELFAFGVYSASRNRIVIALVSALATGWMLGVIMPVRI